MNIYTWNLPVFNSDQHTFFFVLQDLIDRWFLFPENSFSGELGSYWFLTLYITSFFDVNKQPSLEWCHITWKGEITVASGQWVSNIKISILLKKDWFSYVSQYPWNKKNNTFTCSAQIPLKIRCLGAKLCVAFLLF